MDHWFSIQHSLMEKLLIWEWHLKFSQHYCININFWTSLVVQRIRIHLLKQDIRVRSLVRKDPTGSGRAEATTPEPMLWTHKPQLLSQRAAAIDAHAAWSPRSATGEATAVRRLSTTPRGQPLLAATRESLGCHRAMETQ